MAGEDLHGTHFLRSRPGILGLQTRVVWNELDRCDARMKHPWDRVVPTFLSAIEEKEPKPAAPALSTPAFSSSRKGSNLMSWRLLSEGHFPIVH